MDHNRAKISLGLLTRRRDRLLEELRVLAPELVKKLELTLEELRRHEHKDSNSKGDYGADAGALGRLSRLAKRR